MPLPFNPKQNQVVIKFGGGLRSRASQFEIDPSECFSGKNFDLANGKQQFARRKPFDLIATATNGERINGYAQLKKVDGTISTLIQAGATVYSWDGATSFTSVGTVRSGAQLRGPLNANWQLTDVALIADLGLQSPLLQWDGTTLSEVDHNLSGDFKARYVTVENERAIFANVQSGTATPHLLVASKRSDYTNLSTSTRPASGVGLDDPWYLPVPDLRPINGLVGAFGTIALSTERGRTYYLTGQDSTDFALEQLYPGSAASGRESMIYAGNDIVYGRAGAIDSLFSTIALGDVASDDLSNPIADLIEDVASWTLVYDPRLRRIYALPDGGNRLYVYHKDFTDDRQRATATAVQPAKVSPWSLWTTDHPMSFQPTAIWTMLRPGDGIEQTYMGGSNGEIWQLNGSGSQDGGTTDMVAQRISRAFEVPAGGPTFDVEGWISYRKFSPATVTITIEHGGDMIADQAITVNLEQAESFPVYGDTIYYGGDNYYSTPFEDRITRQRISLAGFSSHFRAKVSVSGDEDFFIEDIRLNFKSV